ncbi:hypothetical protein CDG60_16165 [Acinetobacter chinensis]|uniref:Uncharacterized protein n=1 Tax=Acinetobacter chinensis TaxID=2004650 RepID=A0A3B7M029_9GAMM|nr:hypothetical protein CDG60_16165 [Acinetobacter chinensis]
MFHIKTYIQSKIKGISIFSILSHAVSLKFRLICLVELFIYAPHNGAEAVEISDVLRIFSAMRTGKTGAENEYVTGSEI